jgi:lipopolysaccharide biosynthesis regulator YciM
MTVPNDPLQQAEQLLSSNPQKAIELLQNIVETSQGTLLFGDILFDFSKAF